MKRRFETGENLAQHIKDYIDQEIQVKDTFKNSLKKGIVYMQIKNVLPIWSEFARLGIKAEKHIKDYYFVYLI